RIGLDQVDDYAVRKGVPLAEAERWLRPHLRYEGAVEAVRWRTREAGAPDSGDRRCSGPGRVGSKRRAAARVHEGRSGAGAGRIAEAPGVRAGLDGVAVPRRRLGCSAALLELPPRPVGSGRDRQVRL